ncbi:MAG: lipopolysaccharide heptosyltransferase I [Terrimicrobiaceae bacterium]
MSSRAADCFPSSAVIVKPGSMGDVVHALPVAAALKSAFPRCRLGWVIDERWEALLQGNPDIDDLIIFPRERFRGISMTAALGWATGLRRYQPDVVLDLQGLLRSGLIARALRGRRVVGLNDAREGARWFYDDVAYVDPGTMHSVERYLAVLVPLGLKVPEKPVFRLPEGLDPPVPMSGSEIVVHPFARGEGKSLEPEVLDALFKQLAGHPVLLVGPKREVSTPSHVTSLLGRTTLAELLGVLRRAAFVVSVDSGPAHLADALGKGLLAIHTWSDPAQVGPYSATSHVWQDGHILPARSAKGARPGRPTMADAEGMAEFVLGQIMKQGGEKLFP